MNRKRVVILGATGSIGESALKVARDIPDRMEIVGLAAKRNAQKLAAAANEMRAESVCLVDETKITSSESARYKPRILAGHVGLLEIACLTNAEMVLVAIVGTGGLRPALAAIDAGKDLAVASKEILVMAGEIVMREARDKACTCCRWIASTTRFFNAWRANSRHMSGGSSSPPLAGHSAKRRETDFDSITPEQALKHPTWNMGPKITIDSATLFNKGLEMIEAHWLFGVEMERVEVVIHPQSIVHSMVEFTDGSTLAQLSYSDMCFPIQYAVTWPDRVPNTLPPLDFSKLSKLEFSTPRYDDFPALNLARRAGETGGTLPAVMNAANEVAVAAFLDRQVRFPEIWRIVEQVMNRHTPVAHPDLDAILSADQWARAQAQGCVKSAER